MGVQTAVCSFGGLCAAGYAGPQPLSSGETSSSGEGSQRWSVLLPERSDHCNQRSCAFGGFLGENSLLTGSILNEVAGVPYTEALVFWFFGFMLHVLRLVLLGVHFLVAAVVNFAIVFLRPFNPDNTRLCGAAYSVPALRILGLRAEIDLSALRGQANPFVIVANHQSNYDLFVFGCVVPRRTVSIGKTALKWLPLFGQIYWLAGNVLIDRSNAAKAKAAMLKTTEVMQKEDTSIWVFPEGTRNFGHDLLPFKKGAFLTAIASGSPIVPLCCSSYKRTMRLNRWHAGTIKIKALKPIPTTGLSQDDVPALIAQCRSQMQACIAEMDVEITAA